MLEPLGEARQSAINSNGMHDSSTSTYLGTAAHRTLSHTDRSMRRQQGGQPFFIGVAGGTASGKTTVCDYIVQRLNDQCVTLISQDSFYKSLDEETLANISEYNFDHPDAFDTELLEEVFETLKAGRTAHIPVYDFSTHSRRDDETRMVEPADVIIVEGILVLHIERIRHHLNMKIYVDTDDDIRLTRRITRDIKQRGRGLQDVIEQYCKFVKPAHDQFVMPSRRHADIIIPWGRTNSNMVAIDLITQHIQSKLQAPDLLKHFPNLKLIPSNYQIRGMHTVLRDASTSKNDFVFYADRLNRLVVEAGLGYLPFHEQAVTTPTGSKYVGVQFARKICGVSVIRSGESMETALRACCKGIKIGKILVYRHREARTSDLRRRCSLEPLDHASGRSNNGSGSSPAQSPSTTGGLQEHADKSRSGVEHLYIYEKLPGDIADRHVLLMDPVLATGNSACSAIEVLLDKGVQEERILFLSLIAAPQGVQKVCSRYPLLKVITSEIDQSVDEHFQVLPGIGEFGDRYFCD